MQEVFPARCLFWTLLWLSEFGCLFRLHFLSVLGGLALGVIIVVHRLDVASRFLLAPLVEELIPFFRRLHHVPLAVLVSVDEALVVDLAHLLNLIGVLLLLCTDLC